MDEDIWNVYPAAMGEHQAWIAYNDSFGDRVDSDARRYSLRIRVDFNDFTEQGMPTNEEFPALAALDEALDDAIARLGGIYVGRLTVNGARFFYYYSDSSEAELSAAIGGVSDSSGYELTLDSQEDPEKERYWSELYPTEDDQQVIQDLQVIEQLLEAGDNPANEREVTHWAYFDDRGEADRFAAWAESEGYSIEENGPTEEEDEHVVKFTHQSSMHLGVVSGHTIRVGQKARELGGRYDGWETWVSRD